MALVSSPAVAGRAAAIVGEGAAEPGSVSASAGQHDLPGHHLLGAERCRRPGLGQAYAKGYIENRAIEAQRVYDEDPGHPRAAHLAAEATVCCL